MLEEPHRGAANCIGTVVWMAWEIGLGDSVVAGLADEATPYVRRTWEKAAA
jgi:hypothetical protein